MFVEPTEQLSDLCVSHDTTINQCETQITHQQSVMNLLGIQLNRSELKGQTICHCEPQITQTRCPIIVSQNLMKCKGF
jgi:hypothetical protein